MKLFLLTLSLFIYLIVSGQTDKTRILTEFRHTQEIVESGKFRIDIHIATPLNGMNIAVDSAWIVIDGEKACGYLPYYSSGYSFPRLGAKGINFDNMPFNKSLKIKGRNDKKSLKYSFGIVGKNDIYRIQMDIQYDGRCYIYITSNNHSPISYVGDIIKSDRSD